MSSRPFRRAPRVPRFSEMKPVVLPLAERLGRFDMRRRGVRSRWLSAPHASLHLYDARGSGDLPATTLLHGIGSQAMQFGPLLHKLRPYVRRVVAPDSPGHGFSHPADSLTPDVLFESISFALDETLDEPSIVVGNSLGGAVALHYALARPERVRALVLVSPAGAPSSEPEWRALRSAFDISSASDARAFLSRVYHRAPWFIPLFAHEFPSVMRNPAVRDLLETATNEHLPTPDALRSLTMPILFIWGKSERLLPETHFDYFVRHLPTHTVIERPEGFGHCPHFEAPRPLAARIVRFASSLPPVGR
jgi:pimeloyl-ACP methyl ester carboxylesterase